MQTEDIDFGLFALALFLIVANIIFWPALANSSRYYRLGIWVTRLTALIPGVVAVVAGVVIKVGDMESGIGSVLFAAGILLVFGSIQLLALVRVKRGDANSISNSERSE
jgi:hypothetical protein